MKAFCFRSRMPKPKAFSALTWAVVNRFIGRKKADVLSVICDTDAGKVYPVPVDSEHVEWTAAILGVEPEDIRQDPARAAHLVPAVIQLSPTLEQATGVLTGT
jgi:hypothetical protein